MSTASSRTMKAVFVSKEGRELVERPIPTPDAGEILIKNVVVSSNPKDWKLPFYLAPYAAVEGNDVAGLVEEVGEGVTDYKKGDKVAAFSKMRTADKYGAYAEYTVSPVNTVIPLGPKTSFEAGAALPLAYMTAAIGLFQRLGLPNPSDPCLSQIPILINGAGTTVGIYAIQLAKKAGLWVVGIAGKSSDVAWAYGVDEMIDYRGKTKEELTREIRFAAQGKLKYAFDVVSEEGSLEAIAKAFEKEGGKITYTLTYPDSILSTLPSSVTPIRTLVGTAHSSDAEFARTWYKQVGTWLEEGEFRHMRTTVVPGGLGGVQEGLRRLKEGEVSGEKLVYRIEETVGL
ncbi:chaperonin 10-like protein [Leucosporidium creatinivorum]|uniref:Chaperonin 10-like protein n=1 Tax=Leucosporidium creatinivorum TaxID=106004 RepID=A0A1Y2G6S4_9BASI|nr:chaperonin 10-like protein [Leucosporidium creatinivorum]